MADLREMLQLDESDYRQVYFSVVNPRVALRLGSMMEHGNLTASVRATLCPHLFLSFTHGRLLQFSLRMCQCCMPQSDDYPP